MKLKKLRKARGMSQTELSGLTGIAQSHISAIENNVIKPYPGWRERISAALGVSTGEIFAEQEVNEQHECTDRIKGDSHS